MLKKSLLSCLSVVAGIMIAAPAIQIVLYKLALRRGITSADCVRLTWCGAGLLFVYHLWILAGLPGA